MIEIKHLCFGYIKQPLLLLDVNYKQKAKNLFVLGQTSSGKTSLLELLCGMQDLYAGTIEVMGQAPKEAFRNITYLPSDAVVLKNKTVRQNLQFAFNQIERQFDESIFDKFFIDNLDKKIRKLTRFQQLWFCLERAKIKDAKLLLIDIDLNGFTTQDIEKYSSIINELLMDETKNVIVSVNSEDFKKLQFRTIKSEICYLFATKSYIFDNFEHFQSDAKFMGMAQYLDLICTDAEIHCTTNGYFLWLGNRKIKMEDKYISEIASYFDEVTTKTKVRVFTNLNIDTLSDQQFNKYLDCGDIKIYDFLSTLRLN